MITTTNKMMVVDVDYGGDDGDYDGGDGNYHGGDGDYDGGNGYYDGGDGDYDGGDGNHHGEYDVTASRFPSGENSTASKASPRLCGGRMILRNFHNSLSFLFMYHDS